MKNWALINNDLVVELIELADNIVPGVDMFTPEIASSMIDATSVNGIDRGWSYENKQFSAPAPAAISTPTGVDLLSYASQKQNTILAQIWTVDVGTSGSSLKLTTKLDTAGQGAMMKLALWGMLNAQVSGAMEPYSNVDYSTASLTPAQAIQMGTLTGAIVSQSYGTLNTVAEAIQASSPSITTKAQVDAAAWPTP